MIASAKNPQWANAEHTLIDLIVTHEVYGKIHFSASPDDTERHGVALFNAAVAGDFGPIADYVAPIQTIVEKKAEIYSQLAALDAKSIRPMREGDAARVAALEAQSAQLRAKLARL